MNTRRLLATATLSLATLAVPALLTAQKGASASGVRQELIAGMSGAGEKLVALAMAIPAEKYSWRPAPGVRSVSEVFVHMIEENYAIPGMVGVKLEPDVTLAKDSEKTVTDKGQIVDLLKRSFAHAKGGMMGVPDKQMNKMVDFFGSPSTKRGVLVGMTTHAHEHLGQMIAYARMNGVTPPWSKGGM